MLLGPDGHIAPHAPQWLVLLCTLTQLLLQICSGGAHPDEHRPAEHTGIAPEQRAPHAPQLFAVSSRASQPLDSVASQSSKPLAH